MNLQKRLARKPGVITHAIKIQILDWLLRGRSSISNDPKALKNEMRILNSLLKSYPDTSFWLSLRVGMDLNSLCFFLSKYGKEELEKKWRLHRFDKDQAKRKNPLDSIASFPMLAEDLCFIEGEKPAKTRELPPELSRRRTSALDWADSSTE